MLPLDIGALVDVADPRVSPDGATVAVVVTTIDLVANAYRSAVWVVAADGSREPRQVTSGEHRDAKPRWAPDGSALAFVSHREDEGSELYVLPLDGGEARLLASAPEEIEDVAWAPDGTRLAFSRRDRDEARYAPSRDADRPARRITRLISREDSVGWTADRPRRLYVVCARADAEPQVRQVTDGDGDDGGFTWSRDGTSIVFTSRRTATWDTDLAVELYRVDAAGGEPQRLTHDGDALSRPVWSPTDDVVAFHVGSVLDSPRNVQVGVLATDGAGVRVLTAGLDRDCAGPAAPVWDGDAVLFQVNDRGCVPLLRVAADGESAPETVLDGDRHVTGFDVAAGTLAFTAGDATHLPELFVRSAGGSEKQLTTFTDTFHHQADLLEPERFVARSTGGAEVDAWVLRPAGFEPGRRYPTLLNIHGGPFAQYGEQVLDELQVQAGAGYVVLYGNPRGSSGYGEAWGRATRGTGTVPGDGSGFGSVDADDVLAIVDTAVERFDFVDPDRLGVLGGSYGGYLTAWVVGHDHRFRAACAERSVTNFLSFGPTSDIGWFATAYFGVDVLSDPDELWLRSPAAYAADIQTPLLLLHSENDLRCPINQAEDLFHRLKLLGREVELVRFPGESHELSRSGSPRHRVERMEIILEWFERHLGVEGSAP